MYLLFNSHHTLFSMLLLQCHMTAVTFISHAKGAPITVVKITGEGILFNHFLETEAVLFHFYIKSQYSQMFTIRQKLSCDMNATKKIPVISVALCAP